jgi:DNA-binding FadR family transcriptional regulator
MKTALFERKLGHSKKYMDIISLFKSKIISGEIRPGDKLPTEIEMVDQLGISRTPIREAIKILEAIGIIEIKRGEGMFLRQTVSELNLNPLILSLILQSGNINKLIEFRQYFEHMIIELAWKQCTENDYARLFKLYKQQDSSLDLEPEAWVELDLQFHYTILEITRNPFIIEIGKTVYELFRSKMENIARKAGPEHTLLTHKLYLKVIKDRKEKDFEALKRQIAENYSNLFAL